MMETVAQATPEPHRLLFVVDDRDHDERLALEHADADHLVVGLTHRSYPCKVNAAYAATVEPFIFMAADDVEFHPGWLTAALAEMVDGVSVVGTNDMANQRVIAGEHSTHSLVRRTYCDRPGATADLPETVMHEGYRHWCCDDELVQVAKARGAYAHAHDSLVQHHHPYFGGAPKDETYRLGESRARQDKQLFARRRRLWT